MRYADGAPVQLGDTVSLANGERAEVIGDVVNGQFEDAKARQVCSDMKSGYLLRTHRGALVSIEEPSLDDFTRG